jgi:glycogen debranching enzyme
VRNALLRECWDPATGVFYDLDLVAGRVEKTLTISSLFPLILRDIPDSVADRVISEHLTNPDEFWLPFPVPSVAASEPTFDPVFATGAIFRGSTWVNLNWYLYWALRDRGADDIAGTLAERTVAATAAADMRECYGPYDAVGHGAVSFGWSSLVLDMLDAVSPSPGQSGRPAEICAAS